MPEHNLSGEELHRYSRHILLPEISLQGQQKLKDSKVLVVGAGGLGCPLLLYLAAAGVGNITIVDFDMVEGSNLQRQVLFKTADIGQPKAKVAASRLLELNPFLSVRPDSTKLTSGNVLELFDGFDLICDGTDNFPARYLINDACVILGLPLVYGAIFKFEGQVSVFNFGHADGTRSPHYRDLFPVPPSADLIPNCVESGVLGVLPGIVGSLMASEVLKLLVGMGEPLVGRVFMIDTLSMDVRTVKFAGKNSSVSVSSLIDYDLFCGIQNNTENNQSISANALHELLQLSDSLQLVDVREPAEFIMANLGGINIPIGQLNLRLDEISKEKKVVFVCRSGQRSGRALALLSDIGWKNASHLHGGLLAWVADIDPAFPV